jgi:hypothetical protein
MEYMKYIVWLVVLSGGMAAVSAYMTAEVPGGEKHDERVERRSIDQRQLGI